MKIKKLAGNSLQEVCPGGNNWHTGQGRLFRSSQEGRGIYEKLSRMKETIKEVVELEIRSIN